MNARIRSAASEAMTRLKTADLVGATATIQRALTGAPPQAWTRRKEGHAASAGFKPHGPRGLGEILKSLRSERTQFAERTGTRRHPADAGDDDGRFRSRSYRNGAGSLNYKLYIPEGHAERKLALIVMLHGCTQNPDDFARGTRMNALADEFGIVVAYPHQPRYANSQGCWNWFDARHQRRGAGEPAVLAGLAQDLCAEFRIDRGRVFVAGLSAGGAMADVLSSTYPDVFSAAGIHSGVPHGAANDVMSAFAAMKGNAKTAPRMKAGITRQIIFHGTADATVHPSNGEALFQKANAQSGCSPELVTSTVVNGRRVVRKVVGPDTGPASAEYWVVDGAGHAWSGGDRTGSFADATGPDASREMIRFFLGH